MSIPVVDFYGESTIWPIYDLMHCEPLQLRSSRHQWHISPHRHENLLQIFYLAKGSGTASVDAVEYEVKNNSILVIPAMAVHTLAWSPDSAGYVFLVASSLLNQIRLKLDSAPWMTTDNLLFNLESDTNNVPVILDCIAREFSASHPYRAQLLESQLTALMIWLERQRQLLCGELRKSSKAAMKVRKYLGLIEVNYPRQHTVEWYAGTLCVTASHLNSLCKQIAGRTALSLIHNRLLQESQRLLVYTGKTAAEISGELGFTEPAYFNRFFKRLTGFTPGEFRAESGVTIASLPG